MHEAGDEFKCTKDELSHIPRTVAHTTVMCQHPEYPTIRQQKSPTPSYIEGGVFSLDGVHPNGIGYAIIANEFIRVINEFYGANLQTVSVSNYRGITFP